MDYVSRFNALLKALQEHPALEVQTADLEPGCRREEILALARRDFGFTPPEDMVRFYSQVCRVHIEWTLTASASVQPFEEGAPPYVHGVINLLDWETVLKGSSAHPEWKGMTWFEGMEEEDIADMKTVKPFDYYYRDDSQCACFLLEEDGVEERMYLFGNELGLLAMELTFGEYLDLLFESRGFQFWQQAYVIKKGSFNQEYRHYMAQLFPQTDLSPFTQTLIP